MFFRRNMGQFTASPERFLNVMWSAGSPQESSSSGSRPILLVLSNGRHVNVTL